MVDNEPAAREALCQLLEGWGCLPQAVATGQDAERLLSGSTFDVWLFDYHLDDGDDGVALYIRLAAHYPPAPCVVLSADQTDVVRQAVHEAGLALLAKPLRPLALKSVLDRLRVSRSQR